MQTDSQRKYQYRVISARADSHIQPFTMTETLAQAFQAMQRHKIELPGCATIIQSVDGCYQYSDR